MKSLTELYQYFDEIVSHGDCDDVLFASSYLRGFISLAASQYGSETQALTKSLADDISEKLHEARTELTPDDRRIVSEYWAQLQVHFA